MTPDLDAVRAMMEGVTRYDFLHPAFPIDGGKYVRFADYAALAAEVEANRATIAGLEARVEALTGALTALEKQASITANRGAVTGPHWTHLTIACLKARSVLSGGTPDGH